MDQFLRVVAVFLEVSVLGVMIFCLVWGLKLLLDDLGLNKKYDKVIVMALAVVLRSNRDLLHHPPVGILSGLQRSMMIRFTISLDDRHAGSRPMIRRTS